MPKSIEEVSQDIENLGKAWEQFKSVNDRRLTEIEKKGTADPVTIEQLNKINKSIDEAKSKLDKEAKRIDDLDTALARTTKGDNPEGEKGDIAHKQAFVNYLRKGDESLISEIQKKALSVGSDPDGGYLVTPQMSSKITKIIFETSPVRQIASVETISTDSLDIMEDRNEAAAGWTGETGTVSETGTPQLGKKNIPVHELYAQPKATQKLIEDASINIESWLADKLADIFSRTENTAFVNGSGVGKPKGFLQYASGTSWAQIEQVLSGSSGAITADGLIKLFYSLKEAYALNATFLLNRLSVQQVRLLKDTTNQYIWQPALTAGSPDTLLGRPVLQASDMPVPAANSLSVALGDFRRGYQIVDRIGITTLRDPYTEKPFVKFYTRKRVGGDVVNFEAIKLLKLA